MTRSPRYRLAVIIVIATILFTACPNEDGLITTPNSPLSLIILPYDNQGQVVPAVDSSYVLTNAVENITLYSAIADSSDLQLIDVEISCNYPQLSFALLLNNNFVDSVIIDMKPADNQLDCIWDSVGCNNCTLSERTGSNWKLEYLF